MVAATSVGMGGARERPKGPGFVYGALSLAMLLVIAAIALTARTPPPPTVAEFSPQAREQIKDAPAEQGSAFGTGGEGDGAGGEAATTTTTTAETTTTAPSAKKVIDVARVRRCIGSPPRQIEDPQSPPCINYWEGDNGGATYKGVTANEIRIAVPNWKDDIHPRLERFFNTRFELYGRSLKLLPLNGANSTDDVDAQIADATKADAELKAFASLDYSGGNIYYYSELARRGVVSATAQPIFPERELSTRHPYLWQYPLGVDKLFAEIGRWSCARLVGKSASYAGPALANTPRKFGIIHQVYSQEYDVSSKPFEDAISRCGGVVADKVSYQYDLDPQKAANAVLRMSNSGVTSIVCLCHVLSAGNMGRAATTQGYFPEWLMSTYLLSDLNALMSAGFPAEHRTHTIGLSAVPKQVKPSDIPANWALREVDASAGVRETALDITPLNVEYRTLLLVASGIQMAGPKLTPETFAKGLQSAAFPNPETSIFAGKVGFPGGSHSMTLDVAEIWWGEGQRGPTNDNSNGAYCYVDRGARRSAGTYPGPDPFFTGPCDTGA